MNDVDSYMRQLFGKSLTPGEMRELVLSQPESKRARLRRRCESSVTCCRMTWQNLSSQRRRRFR